MGDSVATATSRIDDNRRAGLLCHPGFCVDTEGKEVDVSAGYEEDPDIVGLSRVHSDDTSVSADQKQKS